MKGNLRLDLQITEQRPDGRPGADATRRLWLGGGVDRESRRMIPEPSRWLTTTEYAGERNEFETPAGAVQSWRLEQIIPGAEPSPEGAGGLVLVSMDVEPEVEDEFNDWYSTEHIPLLSAVPGMIRARRFRALQGSPRYVALYHVASLDIYASPAWTSANFTPWMLRMRRFQRNRTYFMFQPVEGGAS